MRLRRTWTQPKCLNIVKCGWTGIVYVARARFVGDIPQERRYRISNFQKAIEYCKSINKEGTE